MKLTARELRHIADIGEMLDDSADVLGQGILPDNVKLYRDGEVLLGTWSLALDTSSAYWYHWVPAP